MEREVSSVELLPASPPYTGDQLSRLGLRGLHCGSGLNLQPGWLNADNLRLVDAGGRTTATGRIALVDDRGHYLRHDLSQPLPLADQAVEWVYTEHFIEHLALEDAARWLREVRRVLRPGGFVRLSTPDLRRYAAGYLDESGEFFARHREHLRGLGVESVPERRAWMLNQIFRLWGHRWIYDMDEIRALAGTAGFRDRDVTECAFHEGRVREVASLDLEVRSDESLYAELVRSG